ncbi:MAG: DNA polymerase III subunit delta [Micropruina sp.]|uniref:DNA polymerase III subunit delta n=1 Tax=Micropruina sp. TaxID=2737536 RepID=UPI0039E219A5
MSAPFATVTLIQGPESLLAERAVQDLVRQATAARPDATVTRVAASGLDRGRLAELATGSLFSAATVVVIEQLADLPADLADDLVALAVDPGDDLALILVHEGGAKGRGLLDRLRKAKVSQLDAPAVKAWELPQFVSAEVRRHGGRIDRGSAEALVGAVGSDLRSVAAAVAQLLADTEEATITQADVHRYFAGRAEISGFAVADHCLDGNREAALGSLRWALETGVAPVLLTSAVASALRNLGKYLGARDERLRDAELARRIGVPPWKLKDLARQARGWTAPAVAAAIPLAARADAQVKGASGDPGFALEMLVLGVIGCRDQARRRASSRS